MLEPSGVISVDEAVGLLANGTVVALPTETVYGLAALALDPDAVQRIFTIKGRPADNPVIVHVATLQEVPAIAEVSEVATQLAASFWPGPLTIVLPARAVVPDIVTAGRNTVAVRSPDHDVFQEILHRVGQPLAAPSANPSGRPSPTTADHVLQDYNGRIPVVDGGTCGIGVESTVVQPTEHSLVLLRPGAISRADLSRATGLPVVDPSDTQLAASPGTRYRHYAPNARLRLFDHEDEVRAAAGMVPSAVILSRLPLIGLEGVRMFHRGSLYDELRRADRLGVDEILVHCDSAVRADEAWMDRLRRAASSTDAVSRE